MKKIGPKRTYKHLIVIMGNTNDKEGLSEITKSRCDKALDLWRADNRKHITATGTFGGHFNTTYKPHFEYIKNYLYAQEPQIEIQKKFGDDKQNGIQSTNTFGDILGIRNEVFQKIGLEFEVKDFYPANILSTGKCLKTLRQQQRSPEDINIPSLEIITSDFHFGRVKFYCDLILFDFPGLHDPSRLKIISTETNIPEVERKELLEHEKVRLNDIMQFPKEIYQNANDEQKHYDNVSNWMITGELTSFALGYQFLRKVPSSTVDSIIFWQKQVIALGLFIAVTFFWMLYSRAAATARNGRKTLKNIERNYSQFGFSLLYSTGNLKEMRFTFKRILECLYIILGCTILSQTVLHFFLPAMFVFIYIVFFYDSKDK